MTQSRFLSMLYDPLNRFNKKIIDYKENDYNSISPIIKIMCKSLEVCDNIEFNRLEMITDEEEIFKRKQTIELENSRLMEAKCVFNIKDEKGDYIINDKTKEKEEIGFSFLLPKLLEGSKFLISDVKYYPMIQIIDFKPIFKKDRMILKTLINKMTINFKKTREKPSNIEVDLYTKKVPLIYILFSMEEPIDVLRKMFSHFEFSDEMIDETSIKIGSRFLHIYDEDKNEEYKQFYMAIIKNTKIKSFDSFLNKTYFIKNLGSKFTSNTNTIESKGQKILYSLFRILDPITQVHLDCNNLVDLILREIKTYTTYNDTQMNLLNKRIRLSEYILFPLIRRLSDNLYMYLNNPYKNDNKLRNIFKINKDIVIDYLKTSELTRYDDSCNSLDVIQKTKATFVGSVGGLSQEIPASLRMLDESYLNRIDLITSPTGDSAGLTVMLSVTNKNLFNDLGVFQ